MWHSRCSLVKLCDIIVAAYIVAQRKVNDSSVGIRVSGITRANGQSYVVNFEYVYRNVVHFSGRPIKADVICRTVLHISIFCYTQYGNVSYPNPNPNYKCNMTMLNCLN